MYCFNCWGREGGAVMSRLSSAATEVLAIPATCRARRNSVHCPRSQGPVWTDHARRGCSARAGDIAYFQTAPRLCSAAPPSPCPAPL